MKYKGFFLIELDIVSWPERKTRRGSGLKKEDQAMLEHRRRTACARRVSFIGTSLALIAIILWMGPLLTAQPASKATAKVGNIAILGLEGSRN